TQTADIHVAARAHATTGIHVAHQPAQSTRTHGRIAPSRSWRSCPRQAWPPAPTRHSTTPETDLSRHWTNLSVSGTLDRAVEYPAATRHATAPEKAAGGGTAHELHDDSTTPRARPASRAAGRRVR